MSDNNEKEKEPETTHEEEEKPVYKEKSIQLREDSIQEVQINSQSSFFSASSFEDPKLGLSPELKKALFVTMKFNRPSKIQEKALPIILSNPPTNLIAQSQSGTGKTAAFTLGMLSRVDIRIRKPQAICLAPTRELSKQIHSVVLKLGSEIKDLQVGLVVGLDKGAPHTNERFDYHVIVGTPGRISDLIHRRLIDSSNIKLLVLDEADHLISMPGLTTQVGRLFKNVKNKQVLFFSATFRSDILQFAEKIVPEPRAILTLKVSELTVDRISQCYIKIVPPADKFEVLCDLYNSLSIGQAIIFVNKKETAKMLERDMKARSHTVSVIHGDLLKDDRDLVMDQFRQGTTRVLIATDVISRGIDIPQVTLVINYDLPMHNNSNAQPSPNPETYLHRIGRTGRCERSGMAINFVDDSTQQFIPFLEKHFQLAGENKMACIPLNSLDAVAEQLKEYA